jgi:hypothetical protein
MAQDNQPDLQVEGWLKTVGIESLCQWDVLVFLYRHPLEALVAGQVFDQYPEQLRWGKWPGSSVSHRHEPGSWLAWNIRSSGPPWKCMPNC